MLRFKNRSDRTRPRIKNHPRLETLEGRQLMSLGAEFTAPVNTTLRNTQFDSANASSANGSSVVVWMDSLSFTNHDIRAQLLNAAGNKTGPELLVTTGSPDVDSPAVAMDAHGDFVVTWRENEGNGDTNVLAQRFDALGNAVGGTVPVGTGTFREHDPSVAMDARGDFVVSYTRDTNNNNPDVFAKRYDVNNNLTNVVSVAVSPAAEDHSSVAMTPDGRFDVAWEQTVSATNHDIFLSQYNSLGALLGTRPIANTAAFESVPSVSMDNSGNAVVAWQSAVTNSSAEILARRESAAGILGSVIPIAVGSANETSPTVALKPTGGACVVAYNNNLPTGTHVGVAEVSASDKVTTLDAGARFDPAVSINGANRYLLTYTSDDNGDFNIRGRTGQL